MKAIEFESVTTQAGQIILPPEVATEIPVGEHVRVVVMWEPSGADPEWRAMGRRNFEATYCAGDAIYEQLIDDSGVR